MNSKQRALLRQFIYFATIGLTGTSVHYLTLWIGVDYLLVSAPKASAVGYMFGSVVNYLMNYFFTFSSSKAHKEAASKYFFVVGIGWCINLGLMSFFVSYLKWFYWIAQLMTTATCLIWNFSGSRWWAFRHKKS